MSDSEDLEAKVAALEERVTALENILHDGGGEHDSTGIREFVISIDPSSHKERALAIAYYLDQ